MTPMPYTPNPTITLIVNVLTVIALVALALFVILEWRHRR